MGVKGLETFIEKFCPSDCCYEVSIEKLVEDHRKETGGEKPVIVFDGQTILRNLYKNLDWVCGGQYKQHMENIKDFLDAFKKLDVEMVFFFGGDHPNVSRKSSFIAKNNECLDSANKTFDELKKGTRVEDLAKWLSKLPVNVGLYYTLEVLYGCEVHNMVNDAEIAQYAQQNKCLAVFGQDSDFLIFETGKYYLSAKHFNIQEMKTKIYDRQKLANSLGLNLMQLPTFATLAGNDIVHYMVVKPFHKTLCKTKGFRYENFYPPLAAYVKTLPTGEALLTTLPDIARKVFKDPAFASLLDISIRNYISPIKIDTSETGNPEWDEVLRKAEVFHRANINHPIILRVLSNKPIKAAAILEDYSRLNVDLPPSELFLRPLRQKLYGILLREKPEDVEPHAVEEWINEEPKGFKGTASRVEPIPPTDLHPGLLELWGSDRSQMMQTLRWQLFVHAISSNLNHNDLTSLPNNLILPTCVLFYIKEGTILEPWEIETLLATVVMLPSMPSDQLADFPADPVEVKAVQIATIFTSSLATTAKLLSVCGFPLPRKKAFSHPYFDGKLFQNNYRMVKQGVQPKDLIENQELNSDVYIKVHQILFKKTTKNSS